MDSSTQVDSAWSVLDRSASLCFFAACHYLPLPATARHCPLLRCLELHDRFEKRPPTLCCRQLSGSVCQTCLDGVLLPPGLVHDSAENNELLTAFVRGTEVACDVHSARCDGCGASTDAAWAAQLEKRAADAFEEVEGIEGCVAEAKDGLALFVQVPHLESAAAAAGMCP